MVRRAAIFAMIGSFLVIGIIDLQAGNTRLGLAGLMLGVVQALIFI